MLILVVRSSRSSPSMWSIGLSRSSTASVVGVAGTWGRWWPVVGGSTVALNVSLDDSRAGVAVVVRAGSVAATTGSVEGSLRRRTLVESTPVPVALKSTTRMMIATVSVTLLLLWLSEVILIPVVCIVSVLSVAAAVLFLVLQDRKQFLVLVLLAMLHTLTPCPIV